MTTALMVPPRAEAVPVEQFETIVRTHQARVYRVLWCELRDSDAAATLAQECFLRAYQSLGTFRGECAMGTWLVRIALNLAHDYRRNRRHAFWRRLFGRTRDEVQRFAESACDDAPSPERALIAREELAGVMRLVGSLSEQQRTVFNLRFVEEFSVGEIAQAMGLEQGTVKAHLARAVAALRRMRAQDARAVLQQGGKAK